MVRYMAVKYAWFEAESDRWLNGLCSHIGEATWEVMTCVWRGTAECARERKREVAFARFVCDVALSLQARVSMIGMFAVEICSVP
jgi:hypothetical protein